MKMYLNHYFVIAVLIILASSTRCSKKSKKYSEKKQFTLLPPDSTGIYFINSLHNTSEANFTFEYRFNGSGIGIGDFNQDGLPDIFFAANDDPCRLYLNKGNFRFEDITERAGILPRQSLCTGVQVVDINTDGFPDIYVCRTGLFKDPALHANQLYINNGNLTFTERAKEYGLDDKSFSNQAAFFDYDNDGDLDMYLVNNPLDFKNANNIIMQRDTQRHNVSDRLYRNDGNHHFTDVTFEARVDNNAFGFNPLILDINRDGWADIFVTNDYLQPDYLYVNNGNGTFTERLSDYFKHVTASSMGAYAGDVNNDGLLDIAVVDMMAEDNLRQKLLKGPMNYDQYYLAVKYGYYYQQMRNQLHLNNGNGTFSETGQLAGISNTDWSWAPLLADFDNDGWSDLFVANGYRRDFTDMDYRMFLLDSINKTGGIQQFKNIYELINLLPATPLRNYFFRNKGDLTFENVSEAWSNDAAGFSNGAVFSDFDLDGDLDVIANNLDGYASVYRNNAESISGNHFIRFVLKGPEKNPAGIGCCIQIFTSKGNPMQCFNQAQGYLSSMENKIHFGLGEENILLKAIITWPDGKKEIIQNLKGGKEIIVEHKNAKTVDEKENEPEKFFEDITTKSGIDFIHQENEFIDFKREPLLMQKFSMSGPCLAAADVNHDGLDDLFAGNAAGSEAALFVQQKNGGFIKSNQSLWTREKKYEDTGALFFDSDNDGDPDLVVCGGGNEFEEQSESYLVRLYLNDGKGNFMRSDSHIPVIHTSCNTLAAADYDSDGDMDLFIGGRIIPGKYPLPPRSYLLKNDWGKFTDVTAEVCPDLLHPGMVTSAVWSDFDNDKKTDLILTGQWMRIELFRNETGKFRNITSGSGLDSSEGWWNCLVQLDADQDGDMDFIAGNLGLNSRIKAKINEPVSLYAYDYDHNGTMDAVMCMYYQGKSYPIHRREELLDQVRMLRNKYIRYGTYANASVEDMFGNSQVDSSLKLKAYSFASSYIENAGNGKFRITPLPVLAQTAPVNSILTGDFNGDGKKDLLMTGNCYGFEVESGRCDAFTGLLLTGNGSGAFTPVESRLSGFFNQLDGRSLIEIKSGNQVWIVCGNNNDKIKIFRHIHYRVSD